MPSLRIYDPSGSAAAAEQVLAEELVIGRGRDCGLRVDDVSVSRQHCRVRRTPRGWLLEDLGSARGVEVGGERVAAHLLCDGERVRLGEVTLAFSDPRAPGLEEPAPAQVANGTGAIEQVVMALAKAGVPTPPVPASLAARASAFDRWRCGTRWLAGGLCGHATALYQALRQGGADNLLALGLDARGQGPAAMYYYLIDGPLALLLELPWTDAYLDKPDAAAEIAAAWAYVDGLLAARERLSAALGWRGRLVICAAGAQGCFWIPGLGRPGRLPLDARGPVEALASALAWADRLEPAE